MSRTAWAGVYVGGVAFHAVALDWIRTLYDGVGFSGDYVPAWVVASQVGAVTFCLMVYGGRYGVLRLKLPVALVLPLVWICFEYLQQFVMGVLAQSSTPFLSLAYPQTDFLPVAQLASIGGTAVVSFLVAAENGFLYELITQFAKRSPLASLRKCWRQLLPVPVSLVAVFVYGDSQIEEEHSFSGPAICLVGLQDTPPLLMESRVYGEAEAAKTDFSVASSPAKKASRHEIDLMVWPELSFHHSLIEPSNQGANHRSILEACPLAGNDADGYRNMVQNYLAGTARKFRAGVLIGCDQIAADSLGTYRHNCLAYADPIDGFVGAYGKQNLAPLTEFAPQLSNWLRIEPRQSFAAKKEMNPLTLKNTDGKKEYQFGCGLCFDVAFSQHFCKQVQQHKIDFFVVAGSEAADVSGGMSRMLRQMTQLRAIEARRPIVRNAHGGYSGFISASGQLLSTAERTRLVMPQQIGRVPLDQRDSIYVMCGNWLFPSLFVVSLFVSARFQNWKDRFTGNLTRANSASRSMKVRRSRDLQRSGFSLMEMLAVVIILGTLALMIIPRLGGSTNNTRKAADAANRAHINSQVERWYFEKGTWPENDLSDIKADPEYFPEGIPQNPLNGWNYSLNATTHRVIITGSSGSYGK